MNPGIYDKRIVWEKKTLLEEQSLSGAPQEEWKPAPFSPLWGAFEMSGGRTFPLGEKRVAETTARVRAWYRADVANDTKNTDRYRIKYLGRIWQVLDIAVRDNPTAGVRNQEIIVELTEVK